MEKHVRIGWLLDFYGGLLTGRQRQMLTSYYDEDLSLAEIAQEQGVSRILTINLNDVEKELNIK